MPANQFVWYELVTSDIDAALSFYGTVIGWEGHDFPGGNERYVILNAKSKGVGGVMALPDGMTQPFWMGYVGTADIDSAVAKFTSSGGNVHRGPWNIPNVGRLALVTDPQGIGLALIQGTSDQPSQAFDQRLPGHGNWNELHTTDPDRAFAFYAEQFGWTKGETVNMGAIGIYQIFKADDAQIGGVAKTTEPMQPTWLYYFGTESIHVAVGRVRAAGGAVLHGPSEVPGGALIVQAKDPQGAMFALVGPA